MEEVIGILFMILFAGGFILKLLGALLEGVMSGSKSRPAKSTPSDSEFAEKLRRHRQQKMAESQAVEAEVVEVVDPMQALTTRNRQANESAEDYYKQAEYENHEIESRDDRMDEHLHDVFDHSLGSLRGSTTSQVQENVLGTEEETVEKRENLAAGIAAMMRDPSDFRKAFIIGEILQRPAATDRF